MAKVDRRILRTRRYLGEALLALIIEKGYDAVSIRDITDYADVAYATFFRHYKSKADLLMVQLEQVLKDIEASAHNTDSHYYLSEGKLLFDHFQANIVLYQRLLTSSEVLHHLKQMIIRNIEPHATSIYQHYTNPQLPLKLFLNHSVSSFLNLVRWWLENDMPYSPDEMAIYYERLVIHSAWWAVGINQLDDFPSFRIINSENPQ